VHILWIIAKEFLTLADCRSALVAYNPVACAMLLRVTAEIRRCLDRAAETERRGMETTPRVLSLSQVNCDRQNKLSPGSNIQTMFDLM
jgi:hypothetical protein